MTTLLRRRLIPGPVLIGFNELFEQSFGDPTTPTPYLKVKPAKVGGALLPFPCVHCGEVRAELVHPHKHRGYRDPSRGFSWCPACKKRFIIDYNGAPLSDSVPAGSDSAPALVEDGNGKIAVVEAPKDGLNTLGAAS